MDVDKKVALKEEEEVSVVEGQETEFIQALRNLLQ